MSEFITLKSLHQLSWVTPNIEETEAVLCKTQGVPRFLHIKGLAPQPSTYRGRPGDWVMDIALGYSGDTQIEIIRPVSGQSIFQEFLEHDKSARIHHVAQIVPESEFAAVSASFAAAGAPLIQSFATPNVQVAYHDTQSSIGVVSEVLALSAGGMQLFERVKRGEF